MISETSGIEPITATQHSLAKIFSDEFAYEIPPYQRPYSWEETQTKELFQDIWDACFEADAARVSGTYFLGSIVLIKSPQASKSDVVDGQQRLTTLTILLCVLRDLSDQALAARRNKFICEEGDIDLGTTGRLRLLPRPQDRKFFEKHIQKLGSTLNITAKEEGDEAQLHFIKNAMVLKNAASELSPSDRDRLVAFLVQRCYLVVISVSSVDTAHRVFRVLNTRGLDLAPTDILKAELLEKLETDAQEQGAKDWEALEISLGRERFVDLFGHIRMIFQKEKPRERLEIGFTKFVKEFESSPQSFLDETLRIYVAKYLDILDASRSSRAFGVKAARYLSFLRRLDNADWVPLVLKFFCGDDDRTEEFLKIVERCAYFLFVCRYNVNMRIARYAKAMEQLDEGKNFTDSDFGLNLTKKEKEVWINHLDGPVYESTRVRLPLLLRLDAALGDAAVEYRHDVMTVEHIIPQRPKKDSSWERIFKDDEDRDMWIHALGNLLLLTHVKNVRASNFEFDRKKKEYFSSKDGTTTFALASTVLSELVFDRETLEKRHSMLLGVLKKTWWLENSEDLAI